MLVKQSPFSPVSGDAPVAGQILNSMLLNGSQNLTLTPIQAGVQRAAVNLWIKRNKTGFGLTQMLLSAGNETAYRFDLRFTQEGVLDILHVWNSAGFRTTTNRVFNDLSAWYNVVLLMDSTLANGADRTRVFINGLQETSFSANTPYTQNQIIMLMHNVNHSLGNDVLLGNSFTNAYVAAGDLIYDNTYEIDAFGEFDENQIWQPKDTSNLDHGLNGSRLQFLDDGINIGADTGGYGNDWTPVNSPTQESDTPSDNQCVLNALDVENPGPLSDGNRTAGGNATITLRPKTGKWYYEKDGVGVDYDADLNGRFNEVLTAGSYVFNEKDFVGVITADHKALSANNISENYTVKNPLLHANVVTYIGDNTSSHSIDGVGFEPDMIWFIAYEAADRWWSCNKIFGVGAYSDWGDGAGVATDPESLLSFDPDGFTVGASAQFNENGFPFAAVCFSLPVEKLAGWVGSPTITPVKELYNPESGISIIEYTGNQIAGATFPHSLGKKPGLIMIMSLQGDVSAVYSDAVGATQYGSWTSAMEFQADSTIWNDVEPTDQLITLGDSELVNSVGVNYFAMVFADTEGMLNFEEYTGSGDPAGNQVSQGGSPLFEIHKSITASRSWMLQSIDIDGFNTIGIARAMESSIRSTGTFVDFLTSGLNILNDINTTNSEGDPFISMSVIKENSLSRAK